MAMYENGMALDKEVERLTEALSKFDPTTDEYKAVRLNLDTIYSLRSTQYKVELEDDEKRTKSEAELKQKAAELEVKKSEVELAEKQRNDAVARTDAEFAQKAGELDVKKRELELAEKQRTDAVARTEAEMKQKASELEIKKRELELAEKQRVDANRRFDAELKQKAAELEARKCELALAEKQHADEMATKKSERTQNWVLNGVNVAVGLIKLATVIGASIMLSDQGYRFEENGVPTSITFREVRKNAIDMIKDQFKK